MMCKSKRAGGGALEGLRVDCDTHLTPEKPQGKSRRERARDLIELRAEYPVLGEHRPLSIGIRAAVHAALPVVHKTIYLALALHCRSVGKPRNPAVVSAAPKLRLAKPARSPS